MELFKITALATCYGNIVAQILGMEILDIKNNYSYAMSKLSPNGTMFFHRVRSVSDKTKSSS